MRLTLRVPAPEAGAIAAMVAAGETGIDEIWVVANSSETVAPCGGCRQKLAEFSSPGNPGRTSGVEGERERRTLGQLLPDSFSANICPRA